MTCHDDFMTELEIERCEISGFRQNMCSRREYNFRIAIYERHNNWPYTSTWSEELRERELLRLK